MTIPPTSASALLVLTAMFNGCSGPAQRSSPYEPQSEAARDPAKAQRLTMQAADLIQSDAEKAERLLREALAADLWHGPAHNDLGVIALQKGDWYQAASEFEWARKLMPGHPDPRMNLGLTLEKAGRVDDAITSYESALEVYPGHIPTIQALTRLQIRCGRSDNRTRELLSTIALEGETAQWRAWAQERLALDQDANATQPNSDLDAPR